MRGANQFTHPWMLDDITMLDALIAQGLSYDIIAKHIDRSYSSLATKASRLNNGRRTRTYNLELTPEKAYLLGVLCGDGYLTPSVFGLKANDEDFLKEFRKCLTKVYGVLTKVVYNTYANQFQLETKRKNVRQNLLEFGVRDKNGNWHVPSEILKCKDETVGGSFLRGFFDSEGSVCEYLVRGFSKNFQGLSEIKELLGRLDIKSRIVDTTKSSHVYTLCITGYENIKCFSIKVGFSIARKQERLSCILKKYKWKNQKFS